MTARRIILGFLIAGVACLFWPGHARLAVGEPASTGASAATSSADDDAAPHVACGPTPYVIVPQPAPVPNGPYLVQPPPASWIQPAPPVEVVPLVPLPQSAGPLQGPMFAAPPVAPQPMPAPAPAAGPLANIAPGGAISPEFGLPAGPEPLPGFANPMLIPITNDELAWEQITSVVTDYFTIAHELQARRNNLEWAEGRIETVPQSGATMFEPFRHDSVGAFNRWESTFQTIRRTALVRVIPNQGGYLVEVIVQKELENLPHPEHATAGSATFFADGSLPTKRAGEVNHLASSPRWIPLGRDAALESRMLTDIHARLTGVTTSSFSSLFP